MSAAAEKVSDRKEAIPGAGLKLLPAPQNIQTREPTRMAVEGVDWRWIAGGLTTLLATISGFFGRRHLQRIDAMEQQIKACELDQAAIKENTRKNSEALVRMEHENAESHRLLHKRIGTECDRVEFRLTDTLRHEAQLIIEAVKGHD